MIFVLGWIALGLVFGLLGGVSWHLWVMVLIGMDI
jgi:hypothetical protein